MAKMFYTTDEAAQKLSVSNDQIKQFVSENRLREFRDGARVMFKVDQVDRLSNELKSGTATGAVIAGKGDSGLDLKAATGDAISLSDSDANRPASAKDDTVVTGQGVSVFDTSEVKPADANMQTQIQSADEGLSPSSLEGVGSGSGLLDLTRESDDTSLGAELLDEIYPGGEKKDSGATGIGSGSGLFQQIESPETPSGPSGLESLTQPAPQPVSMPTVVERPDPSAGAFGGMALASVLAMLLTAVVAAAAFNGASPSWVQTLGEQWIFLAVGLVVISGLLAIVGLFAGKAGAR